MSNGPIVFVTGANTGIGYEVVKALYSSSKSYTIILGSRNIEKGEAAVTALKKEFSSSSNTISPVQVDLETDHSIQEVYDKILNQYGHIDVLVNNAGATFDGEIGKTLSIREGWNKSWDVNVAGTQVLTTAFIPMLLKSADPRLLFVTSGTSSLTDTDRMDEAAYRRINSSPAKGWPKETTFSVFSYRSAKTGLNMMMHEWHRLLYNDGVKVWAISPGYLATGLGGIGKETLQKMGAGDASLGGIFIKDVIDGKRDEDRGKAIRSNDVQPW